MSDLAAFLLERIADTEYECDLFQARWDPTGRLTGLMRRECGAMRRIVKLHADHTAMPCQTLRNLAYTYADHPNYLEEWKP